MRLLILVEGFTEEIFIKSFLSPHLVQQGFVDVRPIIVATRRESGGRKHKGGGHWKHWRRDLMQLVKEHSSSSVRFSTFFDLYGLPKDFPQLDSASMQPNPRKRAELLQKAMLQEIDDWRLVPYIQCHEFEALVLASLSELNLVLDSDADLQGLEDLKKDIAGTPPEDVNDGKESAPSKRLESAIPGYEKVLHGPMAVESLGLSKLRQRCPGFDDWLKILESQVPETSED